MHHSPNFSASSLPLSSPGEPRGPVVLFDGGCGLCHRGVRFILNRERAPGLRFASLDSDYASERFERLLPDVAPPDSMAVVDGDRIFFKSEAAFIVAGHLRAPWRWLRVFKGLPTGCTDAAYDFIARRRHRFQKPAGTCPVPKIEAAKRFLP